MTGTTIGMVPVACCAARAASEFDATITSTPRSTSSLAEPGYWLDLPVCASDLNDDVLSLDVAALTQSLPKGIEHHQPDCRFNRARREVADPRHFVRWLRSRSMGPDRRSNGRREKFSPSHSITSSAQARSVGGTVRPRAFAVLALMINSNLVGCSIGAGQVLTVQNSIGIDRKASIGRAAGWHRSWPARQLAIFPPAEHRRAIAGPFANSAIFTR